MALLVDTHDVIHPGGEVAVAVADERRVMPTLNVAGAVASGYEY
jgi:hypothetical protein